MTDGGISPSAQEFMKFTAITIAERTASGQRQSVESDSKYFGPETCNSR